VRLHVEKRAGAAVRKAADIIETVVSGQREIQRKTLALPTGRTMIPLYAELARRKAAKQLDVSGARTFNLDELLLPLPHPASFSSYMDLHAWHPLGIRDHDIPRVTADLAAECRRYDEAIAAAGGIDLAVVGVGADGHVGYNLPGPTHQETHVVDLPDYLAETLGVPANLRPLRALTMGLGPIRRARHLLMLATTVDKQAAVRSILDGPEDPQWPCSLLRGHSNFDLVVTAEVLAV
jgi:glucosamine-6-phosphate deaminase